MSTTADTIFSDPSVQFLQRLLEDFRKGELTLPRFQRPFVWDRDRRLELFDSVLKGIPIGSLMVWETRAVDDKGNPVVVPKTELGPFRLPTAFKEAPRRFLLDGEQRLMTLYFALHTPTELTPEENDEPATAFEVFFDLEKNDFLTREEIGGEILPHQFPLRQIFIPRGLLRFQRELEDALRQGQRINSLESAEIENKITRFVERTDALAESIRQYKIPVTVMSTDDLKLATETFKRINSQGTAMSESHMMNAIAWSTKFDLLERFNELRADFDTMPLWQSRENLGNDVLLRIAKRLLDRDVYDEEVSEIAPLLRGDKILARVGESLQRVARFLSTRGLRNPGHLSNVMQLVVLGVAFDKVHEPTDSSLTGLEDWLWFTSYTEVFSRMVRGSVYRHLEDQAKTLASGQRLKTPSRRSQIKPLPRFDFRSARSRALSWFLAQRMMPHDGGRSADTLALGGSDALLRLATPPRGRSDLASSAAIRVLCPAEQIATLREQIRSGSVPPSLLEAQVFTPEALDALRPLHRDVARFVETRERDLNALERQRFDEISGRLFLDALPQEDDADD